MKYILVIATLVFASHSHGKDNSELDPASDVALQQTEALLKDSKQFESAAKENNQTNAAFSTLQNSLPEGADQQEAREISAMAFQKMVEETKGDAEKMKAILAKLQTNPTLLEQYLSPEARERLHSLGKTVEGKMGRVPSAR